MDKDKQILLKKQDLTAAYNEHIEGLSLHVLFKLHNEGLREDLVQDTFVKAWKYVINGGTIKQMKPFLYHILNHLIIDEYRKRKTLSLDELREKGFELGFDDSDQLLDIMDGKRASLLIEGLPLKYSRIMKLKYLQNLSQDEISKRTGLSKNTIAVQSHRGLLKLQKIYMRRQLYPAINPSSEILGNIDPITELSVNSLQ